MPPSTEPSVCPSCGVQVQRGVIRCRDCGAFLDQTADESTVRKQSWPGLPDDAAQRAAEAAAAALKVGDSGRTEDDLLHDMDFAESLFRQTEDRIRSVTARSTDEDFLLDVTPISEVRHAPTLKKPPPQKSAERTPASDVKPLATPVAEKPAAPARPATPPAKPVAAEKPPEVVPPEPPAAPPQAASPSMPAAYPNDPYAGYPQAGYAGGAPGYPAGYPQQQGYPPQQYAPAEYPLANYPGYGQQQYGYVDYSGAGYPPGTYPQQYDPNYAAQYGYSVDPATGYYYDPSTGQYIDPATGQYVDSSQYGDPSLQYALDPNQIPLADMGEAGSEIPAELPMDPLGESPPDAAIDAASAEAAAETPVEGAADGESADKPAAAAVVDEGPVKSHAEETAEDILLAAALEEESSRGAPGAGRKSGQGKSTFFKGTEGLVVFCPYGHRVQVQAKFIGKAGRCPLCKTTFYVPEDMAVPEPEQPAAPVAVVSLDNRVWLEDVRLHRVNPAKVKFTPGSLSDEYDTVDLGLNADGILVTVLFKAGGLFRSMQEPKKKPAVRKAVREHLAAGKGLDQIPAPQQFLVREDALTQLRMLQPVKPGEESLFSGVPVFGEGRIVVRIPPPEAAEQRWCLSFGLSQFREFCRRLTEFYGLADFANTSGIPLEDQMTDVLCSFSGNPLQMLEHVAYYQADPAFTLQVVGRKCQSCGAIVDETVRQEYKIGGKQESSVAKSKCPKCQQKFGDLKLYGLKVSELPAPEAAAPEVAASEVSAPEVAATEQPGSAGEMPSESLPSELEVAPAAEGSSVETAATSAEPAETPSP